jgi:hypothetical protein
MKKFVVFLSLSWLAISSALLWGQAATEPVAVKYAAPLKKIFDYQAMFASLDPVLEKVYPVAVVEDKTIYVFEPVPAEKAYRLVKSAPDTFDIPTGVRAAMPLGFWDNRMACVVTPEVFEQPDGYVIIFHEFVHCAQWYGGEQTFKRDLEIFQEAMKKGDYSWELQFPFPYSNPGFVKTYQALLEAWEKGDAEAAASLRADLSRTLSPAEWEYLTWQEWKEGLARNLENRMRQVVGLPENTNGLKPPYDRVTLYVGGDKLIKFLGQAEHEAAVDLEALYRKIKSKPGDRRASDPSDRSL